MAKSLNKKVSQVEGPVLPATDLVGDPTKVPVSVLNALHIRQAEIIGNTWHQNSDAEVFNHFEVERATLSFAPLSTLGTVAVFVSHPVVNNSIMNRPMTHIDFPVYIYVSSVTQFLNI